MEGLSAGHVKLHSTVRVQFINAEGETIYSLLRIGDVERLEQLLVGGVIQR